MRAGDAELREAVWGVPRAHARYRWLQMGGAQLLTRRVGEHLNHLYYREETFFVIEGSSLRSAKATREATCVRAARDCLHLTILRHPVDRVISRYATRCPWSACVRHRRDRACSMACHAGTGSRAPSRKKRGVRDLLRRLAPPEAPDPRRPPQRAALVRDERAVYEDAGWSCSA